jgi:hypothetical protein
VFDCHCVATISSFCSQTGKNEVTAIDRICAEYFSGVLKKIKGKKGKGTEERKMILKYYCSVEVSYTRTLTAR